MRAASCCRVEVVKGGGGLRRCRILRRPIGRIPFFCRKRKSARYLRLGYSTFILDIPSEAEDLETAGVVFRTALERAGGSLAPAGPGAAA
ncbi:MAG: hypothetical protein QJR07_08030 [Acetobacteraceae bacterium]|nr:hypothetical protein [Acetobacteraceae bacterium]